VLKFALFILVINIGFIVLAEIMVEVRNLILKITWGREKLKAYRKWEKARSRNFRGSQKVINQPESQASPFSQPINLKPESVKAPLSFTLIGTILLIILQAYLMARFTLFYHGLAGSRFLPLIFIASIVSLIIHLSARHGWLMISILLSSYLLFGALIYR
jgi:hypothetical protein